MDYYLIYKDGEIIGSSNFPVVEEGSQCRNVTKEEYDVYRFKSEERKYITFKIDELKEKLQNTDYIAIKFAEGILTEEEFSQTKLQRQLWRDEINELEKQLN